MAWTSEPSSGSEMCIRDSVDAAHLERVHHLPEALTEAAVLTAEDALGRAAEAVVDKLLSLIHI